MENNKESKVERSKELMDQIHACGQEILDEFVRICEENGLKYYLIAGTLLGAIRHKGPIPWDDDVDVCMPREDFDKFKKIMLAKPEGEVYHIHCRENDKKYPSRLARLMKSGTSYRVQGWEHRNMKYMELWVDIFPLDSAIDPTDKRYQKHAKRMNMMKSISFNKVSGDIKSMSIKGKCLHYIIQFIPSRLLNFLDEKMMKKYQKCDCEYYTNWGSKYGYQKQTMPKSWYEPSTKVVYNGKEYDAPRKWDNILKKLYGDYMKLPPTEDQRGHDVSEIIV